MGSWLPLEGCSGMLRGWPKLWHFSEGYLDNRNSWKMYAVSLRNIRKREGQEVAEGLSRCFGIFSKHMLHISVCLTAFQALLIPSWLFSWCQTVLLELKHRLQLDSGLFDVKFSSVMWSQSIALWGNASLQTLVWIYELNKKVLGESQAGE